MDATHLLNLLNSRRKSLGMTVDALAGLCGKSPSTVERALAGNQSVGLDTVAAIAQALGAELSLLVKVEADELLKDRATQKAKKLVGFVQSTSALEGQGVSREIFGSMVDRTVHQLMAGSKRKLWS